MIAFSHIDSIGVKNTENPCIPEGMSFRKSSCHGFFWIEHHDVQLLSSRVDNIFCSMHIVCGEVNAHSLVLEYAVPFELDACPVVRGGKIQRHPLLHKGSFDV